MTQMEYCTVFRQYNCSVAFNELTNVEKHYAHYLSKASWEGSLIVFLQTSPESPIIFLLFQSLYSAQTVDELKAACQSIPNGPSDAEFHALLIYSAAFYSNMGNYKSFGDTKFIPGIPQEKLEVIIQASKAYQQQAERMKKLWNLCKDRMYSIQSRVLELGLGKQGLSTYYSSNCSVKDAEFIKDFMQEMDISPYNTRLFKYENGSKVQYELKIASAEKSEEAYRDSQGREDTMAKLLGKHTYKGCEILITRGDYAPLMKRLVKNLQAAKNYASNNNEISMLEEYSHSFTTGSIESHKNGSRFWIKNKGPIIEVYIGFIETYRDPYGIRGEFEGFVAVVNKPMSIKFSELVNSAETLLDELPWPKTFEKDTFLKPDFTSLDIVGFSGSGIPAGINIPNYDDIRQTEGFKNVSLGNVLSSYGSNKAVTFLSEKDQELYKELKGPAFEVQVGLHELLGHGSGKLFSQLEDGSFDFDCDILNPLTGEKVEKWYKPGETYDSKFVSLSSSYEECRAECVGLYLCLLDKVLRIFGHEGEAAETVKYVNWLLMVRGGLLGLEFFTPETNSWKQAHMQARFVITRVLIDAAVVTISEMTGEDGKPDLLITLNRDRIATDGKDAIGKFLCKMQVYKATGDYEAAKSMYEHYSTVAEQPNLPLIKFRNIVLNRKQPRPMFVQCHTSVNGEDEVDFTEYESNVEGMIKSFVDRFPSFDEDLFGLWEKEIANHDY
ncbi:uncharacterized protein TRIADDRAFT_63309 [Trichoplax adhaerens]|uniref:Dipeptidyl peptidase 3 n=1 Tax=Trichoplax adhaerens TaxID=10228 RepID=B3S0Q5_TRIAD|nr:hypothetical protein TRIADDRAFT_63309 [Trichoplax adhaerens]EDV24047.1 hypothetical protein TRIADDRAFT_63309 [Trichoplax adhaerens]|eukprot:XP_002113573.1 hypothetical protein TRIADDRAFT_63309 [Trichoplax adhaerens]